MFRKIHFIIVATLVLVSNLAIASSINTNKLSLPIVAEDIYSKGITHSFGGQFEILRVSNDITNSSKTLKSAYNSYLEDFAKENLIRGEKFIQGKPLNEYEYKQTREPSSFKKGENPLNYMLLSAIKGDYATVVSTYEMFNDDWLEKSATDETKIQATILYSLHLNSIYKGKDNDNDKGKDNDNDKGKYDSLLYICTNTDTPTKYANIACDAYLETLWNKTAYAKILHIAEYKNINELTDYGIYIYLIAALMLDKPDLVINTIESNPSILFRHPQLNDIRIMAEYRVDNFETVTKLSRTASDNIAHIVADSFINTNRLDIANIYTQKVKKPEYRAYLNAKVEIATNKLDSASINIQKIQSEELRIGMLHYYMANNFPNVSTAFILQNFKFITYDKRDFPYYYSGLKQFYDKNYNDSAHYLSDIKYPQSIHDDAIFYSGISTLMLSNDISSVVPELAKIINSPIRKEQQDLARYMLAQVYHDIAKLDEAIQLLDGCTSIHCEQLASKINLELGRYEILLSDPSIAKEMDNNTDIMTINTPQARLTRATAYYNRGYYDLAINELDQIHTSSKDVLKLYMLVMFKDDREDDATQLLINNIDYKPILYSGVKELLALKNYTLVNSLLKGESDLPSDMLIARAIALASLGNQSEAEGILNSLISKHELLYDSFKAKIDIQKDIKSKLITVQAVLKEIEAINKIEKLNAFDRQDELLVYMASISFQGKENVLLLQIVNYFLANHEGSPQSAYIYTSRAELFYTTDRLAECVKDTDQALQYHPLQPSSDIYDSDQHLNTLLIKESCYDVSDEAEINKIHSQIYDLYSDLPANKKSTLNKGRAKQIKDIRSNLVNSSSSTDELLKIAYDVEKSDQKLYITAITKYLLLIEDSDLEKNTELVEKLKVSKSEEIQRINSYVQGRLMMSETEAKPANNELPNKSTNDEATTEEETDKLITLDNAVAGFDGSRSEIEIEVFYEPILLNFYHVYSDEVEKRIETLSAISLDALIRANYVIDTIKKEKLMSKALDNAQLKFIIPNTISAAEKYIKVK